MHLSIVDLLTPTMTKVVLTNCAPGHTRLEIQRALGHFALFPVIDMDDLPSPSEIKVITLANFGIG